MRLSRVIDRLLQRRRLRLVIVAITLATLSFLTVATLVLEIGLGSRIASNF